MADAGGGAVSVERLRRPMRGRDVKTDGIDTHGGSSRWLRAAFEHATSGIALIDLNGHALQLNPALERMFGCPEAELRMLPFFRWTHADEAGAEAALFAELIGGAREHYQIETRFERGDGSLLRCRLTVSLLRDVAGRPEFALCMADDLTAYRAKEEQLVESLQSFRRLYDAVTETVCVQDAEGRLVAVNRAAERMYGFPRAEILGNLFTMLYDAERTDAEEVRGRFERALAGEPQQLEVWGRRKNGRSFPMEMVMSTTMFLGEPVVITTVRDVTMRKVADELLESERAHLEQLFESSPEGIALVDSADRVLRINPEFTRLFGYTEGEAVGRTLRELIVPEGEDETALSITQRIAEGQRVRVDALRRHKDGTQLEVLVTGAPVSAHGNQVAVFGIYQDIRERKELERALRRLSTTDVLTGLLNRRGFMELAEREWALATRRRQNLLLLYMDLDGFKAINDSFGHAEGDRLLQDVASLLQQCFRTTDVITRLGGDEFVVLAVDAQDETEASLIARVQEAVQGFNGTAGRPYELRVSVGAYRSRVDTSASLGDLLAQADRQMYERKRGRADGR